MQKPITSKLNVCEAVDDLQAEVRHFLEKNDIYIYICILTMFLCASPHKAMMAKKAKFTLIDDSDDDFQEQVTHQ